MLDASEGNLSPIVPVLRFRRRVLQLAREKYGEDEGERFDPTLAAEHLTSEGGLKIDAETLRRWMREEGLWRLGTQPRVSAQLKPSPLFRVAACAAP
jgi:hypothetical protein